MTTGIYAYWDNENNYYAYVGKDSNLDKKKRHSHHKSPNMKNNQKINQVIQNNPERYEYRVLMKGDYSDKQLNKMEKFLIKHLKTFKYDYPDRSVFNFTKGGDGMSGIIVSDETKKKLSEKLKGENNPNYGKPLSEKHKQKLSENHVDVSKENNPCWKDYARIIKQGFHTNNKQRYAIKYNGKIIKRSIYVEKLEKWFKENYPNEKLINEVI